MEGIVLVVCGAFVLAAIGSRWPWFMKHWKVEGAFRLLGETGAVILYVATGLFFVILGLLMMLDLI